MSDRPRFGARPGATSALGALCLLVAVDACTGSTGDAPGGGRDEPPGPAPGGGRTGAPGTSPSTGTTGPGPAPGTSARAGSGAGSAAAAATDLPLRLVRLTREQYAATLKDLLGDGTDVTADLPVDTAGDHGFAQSGPVGALEARRFMDLADAAATRASRNLPTLMGCDPTKDEAGCVAAFVPRLLKRAYRRPPTEDELLVVDGHYKKVRALPGQDAPGAMRALLAAVLQSPAFLYRWELGPKKAPRPDAQGLIPLDDHELASRLSYFLTGSMPDQALFAAADAGQLRTPAQLATEAKRLLGTPRARAVARSFHEQWLGLGRIKKTEKDTAVYKVFTETVRAAMEDETRAFLDNVLFEGDGKLDTLLGASFAFAAGPLAKLYGVAGASDGAPMKRVDLDPAQRFGLLTQGSFLATHAYPHDSAPIKRGVAVREALLCQDVPSPPRDLAVQVPEPDLKKSIREQFEQHSSEPACKGCHALFDPLGFAFENYDGIGRWRTSSGGKVVDASGTLTGLAQGPRPFRDARELMAAVRTSPELRACVTATWLRFALGRRDTKGDGATLEGLGKAFEASSHDVRELLLAIVQSASFRFRTPSAGEVLQ